MGLTYGGQYTHLAANATTQIKAAPGVLNRLCINTKGASSNTLTLVDNTSGTTPVVAVIDTTANVAVLPMDIPFTTGIRVIIATGTAPDVTLVWS